MRVSTDARMHYHPAATLDLFYTYLWRDASGVPFYVGKGKGRRAWVTTQRSKLFKEIHARGGCTVEIIDYFIHESQAHAHEMALISRYGRLDNDSGSLVNLTDGGEGNSGWVASEETRAKISKAAIGRTASVSTKALISAAHKGRKLRPEHVAKIARANTGRRHTEEAKAKVSAANLGNTYALGTVRSADTRAKISASKKGQASRTGAILSTETRAKIAASLRGRKLSEDHRAKLSAVGSGVPKTSEHVSSVMMALHLVPPRADSSSGYKGVSSQRGRWAARITVNGVRRNVGRYGSAEDAARAYDSAAIEAWGRGNCYLNFPDDHVGEKA
ncbi:hypothetical protein FHW77_001586 [Agrobacterium sp. RC10-4-1]|uniref:NUMOD3 domain-containing DNA-binding protein n=1 Tax=Agrobacterium sp. RC10-4-1 TaxID=2587039 RepID=UPI0015FBCAAE|nr:NUMOD3 domain-containing DNA-binding protein [Agrobacterium sp. RC10-4-1]MBA8797904.1 hypothetical protein [Agrobacterium sp. RC10-4-1]